MEKENYRVNKAYCSPIKNQNEPVEPKESKDERRMHEEKHFRIKMTDEEKKRNEKKDDEGIYSPQLNTMFGLCAICHLAVGNINSAFNQNVPCCEEHILCQRCIEQFSIPSDPGCILCHEQFQQSNLSIPQESNTSLNSIYIHPRRMHIPRQQPEYYVKHHQSEQSNVKNWKQNYSTAVTNTERNMWGYYNADDSEESTDYERIKDQNNIHEERGKDDSKQRQQYSCCNLYKRGNTDLYMTEARVNGQITAECSRRPIRCPRIDCAINVAFSALTHHFIFDHPEVPILNVEPGIKSTLIVSFNALSLDSSRCLALLLVSGKLSDPVARLFNGSQINPKFRNRLPLPVLAARLQCNKINNKKDYHKKNIIIAWVAGIDIGNTADKLLCSIQAVDKFDSEGLRSLTYTGPVNSLRTAQCPQDIFSTGDCIVLHEGLLSHITSDCATLNVNVTVH